MSQKNTDTNIPKDVPVAGDEQDPQYGIGATYTDPGYKNIDNRRLQSIFGTIFDQADRYRERFVPEWLKCYQQYNGDLEDRKKDAWQSQINIPLPNQAVDTSAARIIDALFGSGEDFFDILPKVRQQDPVVNGAKALIKWNLWKAGARDALETSVKDALICGTGPMKIYYDSFLEERSTTVDVVDPESPDQGFFSKIFQPQARMKKEFQDVIYLTSGLRVEPIMPTDIWLDPSGRNEFIIHRVKRNISDVWALTEDQVDSRTGETLIPAVYDPVEVSKVRPGQYDGTEEARAAVLRRDTPHLTEDLGVDLFEFWGNMRDPRTGAVLFSNVVATFAMRQYVLRRPQKNPFRHRKPPFIILTANEQPHQIYGYGLLKQGMLIHDAINRMFNVVADKAMLQVPTVEMFPGAMRNAEQATPDKTHFVPGKIWQRRFADKPIWNVVQAFPPLTDMDLQFVQLLMSLHQQSTAVGEFVTGQPQSNNRKTKEEVEVRTQAAQATFNSAARHIESSSLSPMLKMIYYLTVQYENNYTDEQLLRMVGEETEAGQFLASMKMLSDEDRWDAMYLDAEFRVTGISLMISRQDKLNKIMGFMKVLQANPLLMAVIDQTTLLRILTQCFDLPPAMILEGAEAMVHAQQMAQIQAQLNPQGQQNMQQRPGMNQYNASEQAQSAQQNMPPEQGGGQPQ